MLVVVGSLPAAEFDDQLARLGRERPQTHVIDKAGVFSPAQWQELNAQLEAFERTNTVEIAVVVLPDIGGGEIDDFTVRLFKLWGIGKKEKNNGVLLLAALKERKVRIEPGYGLEPVLPDAACGRIIDEAVLPSFREQKFAEGLSRGAQQIIARIAAQAGGPGETSSQPPAKLGPVGFLILFGFLGLVVLILVVAHKRGWTKNSSGNSGGGSSDSSSGGGGGGFGGGCSGGGGASRGW
jgi:uncharacterized protein